MANFKGTVNDDSWTGTDAADSADGGAGNDYLQGVAGNDTLTGGAGNDVLYGGPGNDVIDGGAGDDVINGDAGGDTLRGGDGNDYISDTSGDGTSAYLYGGAGDDVLLACFGKDYFDGGDGNDSLWFVANIPGAVNIDLGAQTIFNDGYGYKETLVSVENVIGGTRFADTLIGSDGANILYVADRDTVSGRGGNDTFNIGSAADAKIDGGAGIDTAQFFDRLTIPNLRVDLGAGKILDDGYGGKGTLTNVENVIGASGNDTLTGSSGANRIEGSWGNDLLVGLGGADRLDGGIQNDTLVGGAGRDTLTGGQGTDLFRYAAVSEFGGKTTKTAELITDFRQSDGDRIDLSAIDAKPGGKNNAFKFIGTESFHGIAGELRYSYKGGDTYVIGDTNGDRKADFMLHLDGTIALTKTDFIL